MSRCAAVGCDFFAPADESSVFCSTHREPAPREEETKKRSSSGEEDYDYRPPCDGPPPEEEESQTGFRPSCGVPPPLKRARTSEQQEVDDGPSTLRAMSDAAFVAFCGTFLRSKMESKSDVEAAVHDAYLTAEQARILILAATSTVSYVMLDRDTTVMNMNKEGDGDEHVDGTCGVLAHVILARVVPSEVGKLSLNGAEGYYHPDQR